MSDKKHGIEEPMDVPEILTRDAIEVIEEIKSSILDEPEVAEFKENLEILLVRVLGTWGQIEKKELRRIALRISDKMLSQWIAAQSDVVKAKMRRILSKYVELLSASEKTEIVVRKADRPGFPQIRTGRGQEISWSNLPLEFRKEIVGRSFARQIRETIDNFAAIDEANEKKLEAYMRLGDRLVESLAKLEPYDLEVPAIVSAALVAAVREHFGMRVDFCINKKPTHDTFN